MESEYNVNLRRCRYIMRIKRVSDDLFDIKGELILDMLEKIDRSKNKLFPSWMSGINHDHVIHRVLELISINRSLREYTIDHLIGTSVSDYVDKFSLLRSIEKRNFNDNALKAIWHDNQWIWYGNNI